MASNLRANESVALSVMSNLPLPVLPQTYTAAKLALQECTQIDECKEWADKAAALASYAKQAEDDTLLLMARRIQSRAVHRQGEILREIESAPGRRTDLEPRVGAGPRFELARDAGLSPRQAKTALRVSNVPKEQFEALIESDNPPTITRLAELGTKKRDGGHVVDLGDRTPEEFQAAGAMLSSVGQLYKYAIAADLALTLNGLAEHERARLLGELSFIIAWGKGVIDEL